LEALATYSPERALDALVGPLLLWTVVNLIIARVREQPHYGYPWKKDGAGGAARSSAGAACLPEIPDAGPPCRSRRRARAPGRASLCRVFTARGEDLILYRFSDAVEEMGEAGLQVLSVLVDLARGGDRRR
jgi:hypothetical protein